MDARTSRYFEAYARWQRDPQGFWAEAAQAIDWIEPAKQVFDPAAGVYGRWFVGGVCNTCWNAVDRHVMRGRGDQPAVPRCVPAVDWSGSGGFRVIRTAPEGRWFIIGAWVVASQPAGIGIRRSAI